jgi:rhodanese-related sulfurtransferase
MKKFRLLATSLSAVVLALASTSLALGHAASNQAARPADKHGAHRQSVRKHSDARQAGSDSVRAELLRFIKTAPAYHYFDVSATSLHAWLQRKDKPILLDVRLMAQPPYSYLSGHIPGAYSVPKQFFYETLNPHDHEIYYRKSSSSQPIPIWFPLLSKSKTYVVMCYSGTGADQIATLLRIAGYHAYALQWGVSSWNQALNVYRTGSGLVPGAASVLDIAPNAKKVAAPVDPIPDLQRQPSFAWKGLNAFKLLRDYTDDYLNAHHYSQSGFGPPFLVLESSLVQILRNDPSSVEIVDLDGSYYNTEHIKGSVHIPFAQLGSELDKLNPNKKIILVSHSMQRAAEAIPILRLLGYHVYVLERGLASFGGVGNDVVSQDYPLATGLDPAELHP